VIGGVYSPKIKFSGKFIETDALLTYQNSNWYVVSSDRTLATGKNFEMPRSFGLGVTYQKFNKLTVGADVLWQQWGDAKFDAKFFGRPDTLSNIAKINVGGEYIPDIRNRSFFSRIRYRAGAYYSDSYIKVQGAGYKQYGVSVGVGLPMVDDRSLLNVTFEYMTIHPQLKTLINEQYFKFTLSYTFNEWWFFKRKVQ
jgi:hypothetical protein